MMALAARPSASPNIASSLPLPSILPGAIAGHPSSARPVALTESEARGDGVRATLAR